LKKYLSADFADFADFLRAFYGGAVPADDLNCALKKQVELCVVGA
jgi:hypothetical protein